MSSSPGLPPQQATTTSLPLQQQQNHHHHRHHHYPQQQQKQLQQQQQQQQQQHQQQKKPPLPTVSPSKSPRNNGGGDSEAETVVVQQEVPLNARKNVDETSEYERGRRRRAPETRAPADQERPYRTRPLRQGPTKRRLKQEDRDEEYSSDLSSPSRSSHPNSPSRHIRRRTKHGTGFQKRKTNGTSTASEGDNSDHDDTHHGRLRRRKRRRSVMDPSPSNIRIKSSPPVSPQPLGSPIKSTRTREKAHTGQRTLKHRKIPPPLVTSRGDPSSSSSRDNSPSSVPRPHRPQSVRTPGSPMSTSHKPKRDIAGRTHLHRACQRGAVAEVEAILEQGKEFLNAEDNAGYLPLHEACLHGRLEVAKILIINGAWLDVPSRIEQDTPLLDAVDNGHADVVKYLLELGADPRKRNKQGKTALDANDSNRDTPDVFQEIEDLLKVAINKLRKRPSDDEAARASAAADSHSSRDPSVASPVHQSPPAPSIPTGTRRRNARTEQSRKDLLWLDAGKNGLQKLREKAREGDQQMVHALLERGTKPDTESLIGAIKGGHADTVSLLLAYGDTIVDPEPGSSREGHRKTRDNSMPAGEETPMLAAIGRGNLTVLGYLLENGVNPRRLDSKGKSYMEIARDREGEFWQDEVELLKKAWDKVGGGSRSEKVTRRGHSPKNHRNTSPKPKKSDGVKGTLSGSRRLNSTLSSANAPRRSASANPSKYEDTVAVSDQEAAAEPLGPPKHRGKKGKRSESDSFVPPVTKKKRRLISGKDLANEESLARSSQEPTRLVPSETDIDPSEKKLPKKYRPSSITEEVIRVEQKPPGRKLRMGSEDMKMSDSPTERVAHKFRADHDSNLLRPDNILSSKDKKPTLGGRRDRTRSPTSHSDTGRRPEKDAPRKQRKIVDHKQERYDSDSTAKRIKLRKPHPTKRDSPDGRRPSVSTTETSEKEEERRRLREQEVERQERREREKRQRREDEKRRVELRRQDYLKAELESILSKAQDESKQASMDQIINRELRNRQQREEKDRREKELREEEEEREAKVKEKREREERERLARRIERQTAEREAKERELKEARELEAEQKRYEEERKREEARRNEEERKREEARRLEKERKIEEARRRAEQEEFQKRLAEEQRRKEEEAKKRQEALENQRRAEEAERKRKAAEEEVRKRQEFERGRREAELLQQQLALEAERKRLEDEERKRELARKKALPFALRRVEENYVNDTTPVDSLRFMPLYSAILPGSYPTENATPIKTGVNGCGPQKAQQYILNVQAALVLGITDLDFTRYPGVRGRDANDQQRLRMWSVLSVMLCESVYVSGRSIEELEKSRKEEKEKFLKIEPVFWMKVDDLRTIINADPKYANLANLVIRTVDVDLSCSSYTTPVKLHSNGNGNGPMTPASTSTTKEEMALRLQRLFGTPPASISLQCNQSQAPSTPSPLPSQPPASMPPHTPVNETSVASTSSN